MYIILTILNLEKYILFLFQILQHPGFIEFVQLTKDEKKISYHSDNFQFLLIRKSKKYDEVKRNIIILFI